MQTGSTDKQGQYEEAISTKVNVTGSLAKTLREKITACLKDYAVTPAQAQSEKVNLDRCILCPISDLKPEKLHMDDNPGKLMNGRRIS